MNFKLSVFVFMFGIVLTNKINKNMKMLFQYWINSFNDVRQFKKRNTEKYTKLDGNEMLMQNIKLTQTFIEIYLCIRYVRRMRGAFIRFSCCDLIVNSVLISVCRFDLWFLRQNSDLISVGIFDRWDNEYNIKYYPIKWRARLFPITWLL